GGERIFFSKNYKDYIDIYAQSLGTFTNRVHGGVCAVGFGRPSVIIGNDSRLRIAEYVRIPYKFIAEASADEMVDVLETSIQKEGQEKERLISWREQSAIEYKNYLQKYIS